MSCQYYNCPFPAAYKCSCQNPFLLFCNYHAGEHLKVPNLAHNISQIPIIQENTSKIIIQKLTETRSKASSFKMSLISSYSKIVTELEGCLQRTLKSIQSFTHDIDLLIINIQENRLNISEGILFKALHSPESSAKSQCENWNLISYEFNDENMIQELRKNKGIINNLYSLYLDANENKSAPGTNNRPNQRHSEIPKSTSREEVKIKQPRPVEKKVICPNKHELSYNNLSHFNYWKKNRQFLIKCGLCDRVYSNGSWHCEKCSYDICPVCSDTMEIPNPMLKCLNKHELKWRCDYNNYPSHSFSCKKCRNLFENKPRWNCSDCKFDICIKCGLEKGYKAAISEPECCSGQKMKKEQIMFNENSVVHCTVCDDIILGEAFICSHSGKYKCECCAMDGSTIEAPHPLIVCGTGHILKWCRQNKTCSYCKYLKNLNFFCEVCDFSMCLDCGNKLVEIICKPILKNYEGSTLNWLPNCRFKRNQGVFKICVICSEDIGDNGSFYARDVSEHVCLLCFNGEKPKSTSASDRSPKLIMSLILLNQLDNI